MKKLFMLIIVSSLFVSAFAQTKTDDKVTLTPKQIVEKYIDAIGGKDAYMNIKDRTMFMTATVQGMTIKMTVYQKEPNKFKSIVEVAGMEQVIVYDGKKAYMKANDKVQEITGKELDQLSYQANIHMAVEMDSLPVTMTLAGIEKVDEKDAYKIDYVSTSGDKWSEYYDKESFLKVKEVKEVSTPQGSFTQDINYSDYKDYMGVKIPYKISQKLAGQELSLVLKSIEINTNLKDSIFE
jgi:outer membrane lipoprotein-sorting protein